MMVALHHALLLMAPCAVLPAACVSFVLTGRAIGHAQRRRWLAHPEERSSHSVPTPQVGGVGVCGALLVGLLACGLLQWSAAPQFARALPSAGAAGWLLGAVAVGLAVGLWDDLRPFSAWPKLAAISVLTVLATAGLWQLSKSNGQWNGTLWTAYTASGNSPFLLAACVAGVFVWILCFVNAYNFMDGVNGQSAVYGLNVLFWFFLYAARGASKAESVYARYVVAGPEAWLICLLAGALLGFLPWNFPRAKTFLGDCGSMPVGALLAVLLLALERLGGGNFVAGLFVLAPYIYDVAFTFVRRWRRGENVWVAHRSHLYQRLLIATGWSHARLLAYHLPYWVVAGGLGMNWHMIAMNSVNGRFRWTAPLLVFAGLAVLLLGYTRLVWQAEARRRAASAPATEASASQEDRP